MAQIGAPISDDLDRRIQEYTARYRRAKGSASEHRAAFVREAIRHYFDAPELKLRALQKRVHRLETDTNLRLRMLEASVKGLREQSG